MMSKKDSKDYPMRCRDCRKQEGDLPFSPCQICERLNLKERVLCDLNRFNQSKELFRCHAFKPNLKIVGSEVSVEASGRDERGEDMIFSKERIAYRKALSYQR